MGFFGGIRGDLRIDLRRDALHQHLRWHVARVHALAQQQCGVGELFRDPAHPRQPVAVVLRGLEGQHLGDVLGILDAATLADCALVFAVRLPLHRLLQLPQEHVVVELVGRRQPAAVDATQARQHRAVLGLAARDGGQAQVGPAVVIARVAAVAGGLRRFAQAALPLGIEQRVQRPGLGRLRRCGLAMGLQRRCQQQGQGEGRNNADHGRLR